jgi:hypothetical protein
MFPGRRALVVLAFTLVMAGHGGTLTRASAASWDAVVHRALPASSNEQPSYRAVAPDPYPHTDRYLALGRRNPTQCQHQAPLCRETCRSNADRDCFIDCMHSAGC